MPHRARSLTDDLRARSDTELAELLILRPDLARPVPVDLTTLVARATTPTSVQWALDSLNLAELHAVESVLVAAPTDVSGVARLLGLRPRSARAKELVDALHRRALIWLGTSGYHPVRTLHQVIRDPGGLGPDVDDSPRGAALQDALESTSPEQRTLLDALTWGPPVGLLRESGNGAGDTDLPAARPGPGLIAAGLLHRIDAERVVLPRAVGLQLRGGLIRRDPATEPPSPPTGAAIEVRTVDQAAGARAGALIDLAAEVIEVWGAHPPRVLKSGGLGVRDLGLLATTLDQGVPETGWLLETMAAAGLVAAAEPDRRGDAVYRPTTEADLWAGLSAAQRWERLAAAWYRMSAAPWSIGPRGEAGGRVNALSFETSHPAGRRRRQDALTALTHWPPTQVLGAGDEALAAAEELLRWYHPVRASRSIEPALDVLLREAEWAGVLGHGTLSTAGRAVIADQPAAAVEAMSTHIPAPVDRVLVQADLTAIAPGRLDGSIRATVHLLSDVESRGGATVHRFSEASLRRGLDAGWSADRITEAITAISATGLPQPLEYLITDVARRHGVARVGAAGAYLRSDDPALLDRILADRALSALGLHRIAPTVLVSSREAGTVLGLLRERQYSPVAESADGRTVLATADGRRAAPPRPPSVTSTPLDLETAARVVAAMRAGERVRDQADRDTGDLAATEPVVTMATLSSAAADGAAVVLGYADEAGGVQRLLFWPTSLDGGRVRGQVEASHQSRTLLLHRITGAHRAR